MPNTSPSDTTLLWQLLEAKGGECAKQALRAALAHPAFDSLVQSGALDRSSIVEGFYGDLQAGQHGDWQRCSDRLRMLSTSLAAADADYRCLHEIVEAIRSELTQALTTQLSGQPVQLLGAMQALQQPLNHGLCILGEQYVRMRDAKIIVQQEHAEQALRSSERRFTTLFDAGLIGILICDLAGNIKEANDAFLDMVGYTRDEVLSGSVRWSEMTPPEWRHLDDEAILQLQARGVTGTWEKEYLRKDGSRVPILVGVAMLGDADCIAFALDITERKRLDALRVRSAELETQNRRVQESSRLKNEFLANMSHELRTPLNSIIGFADMLCDGEVPAESPRHHEFLANILKSGRHLLQLINDVLDLAKVEAGKLEFTPEPVDLVQLVAEITAVLRSIAAAKQIRIEVEVDPDCKDVCIDPSRTKQILYNYASNALKFSEEGGRVIIRARPEDARMFRLEVEDSGIGIAEKDLGRLFVEFQQLDAGISKRHAGTGLGLALTKRIVEEQGGSVGVKSTPGVGSLFFAILPRQAKPRDEASARDALPEPSEGAATVLVIEDDPRDRGLLVQVLNRAGYGVMAAATGGQAIESCAARTFDAITLDLLLPDITGLDVLHRIRTSGKNQATPVVVVSVVAERGVVGGFAVHDYLQKPINGSDLVSSLRRAHVTAKEGGTILVVDDDAGALLLMETALLNLGYRVYCRPSGESALQLLETEQPDAVILDLLMPGIDGFGVLTQLRQRPGGGAIPVIIWTTKDLTAEDNGRLHDLAQAVMLKGDWQTHSLTEQLRFLLRRTRSARGGNVVT